MGESKELRHELNMLQSLCHPNLIQVRDSFKVRGKMYLVMEKADCGLIRRPRAVPGEELAAEREDGAGDFRADMHGIRVHT